MQATLRAIAKPDFIHDLLQMGIETLQICRGSQRHLTRSSRRHTLDSLTGHIDLVTDELRGHSNVERCVVPVGGNAQQCVGLRQLLVGQAKSLGAKHHGHCCISIDTTRFVDQLQRCAARIDHPEVLITLARGGGHYKAAISQGFFQCCHHAGRGQYIVGTGSARSSLGAGVLLGIDQHQIRQRHVLHSACHGTDVAGVAGVDQNKSNGQVVHRRQGSVAGLVF